MVQEVADDKMAEGYRTTKEKKTRQRHQRLGVGQSSHANWTFGRNT